MRVLLTVILILSSINVWSKVGIGNLELYVFRPLKDDGFGGSIRYQAFKLEENSFIMLDNRFQIISGTSLLCSTCETQASNPFLLKIFEISRTLINNPKQDTKLFPTIGLEFELAKALSDGKYYQKINFAKVLVSSGYLLKLKSGEVVLTGSLGAGFQLSIVGLTKEGLKELGLQHRLEASTEEVPLELELLVEAKLTLSIKDTLFLKEKFLLGQHATGHIDFSRRTHELSISATPLRAISNSRVLKSLAISLEHRTDHMDINGHTVSSDYTGVGAGISF